MKFTIRNMLAITTLVAMISLLLSTVRGPILSDGVAFYAPIILGACLSWRLYSRGKSTSILRSFVVGALGGLLGNLIWPTGILIGITLFGNTENIALPPIMILSCVLAALATGGAFSATLTAGFPPPENSSSSSTECELNPGSAV